jgi:ribosomal protein L29
MVGNPFRCTKQDIDAKSDSTWRAAMAADGLQLLTFRIGKDEPGRRWKRHAISMRRSIALVKTIKKQEASAGNAFLRNLPKGASDLWPPGSAIDRFLNVRSETLPAMV